jgi:hypothetical protein
MDTPRDPRPLRRRLQLGCVLLVSGVLGACGGDDDGGGATPTTTASSPAATSTAPSAPVAAVSGSAFGESLSIGLFGGAPFTSGPTPQVKLPPTGGSANDAAPSARSAPPGNPPPVVFLKTDALEVSTSGQPSGGSATSTAKVTNPNALSDFVLASRIESTCTSTKGSSAASTTLAGATFTNGPETRPLPANPAPNETIEGVQPDVNDRFKVVFNEQTRTETSITVNAVHIYLLGPSAVGEIIIAQAVCGVTP